MSEDVFAAAAAVFGPPRSRTVLIRLSQDAGDGVPFVLQLMEGEEPLAMIHHIASLPTKEEKDFAWIREPLVFGLRSVNGRALPPDIPARRKLVYGWVRPVVLHLVQAYNEMELEEEAALNAVEHSPNPSGATSGPSSAPVAAGPTVPSPSASSPPAPLA